TCDRKSEGGSQRRRRAVTVAQARRNGRKRQAVGKRKTIAFARSLIRKKEEGLVANDSAAESSAELIARQNRPFQTAGFDEWLVRVQGLVSQEVKNIAMKIIAAGTRHSFDIATCIAPFPRVVKRSLDNELLQAFRARHRQIRS